MLRTAIVASTVAFSSGFVVTAPAAKAPRVSMPVMADIGETGVSFENVAREWYVLPRTCSHALAPLLHMLHNPIMLLS